MKCAIPTPFLGKLLKRGLPIPRNGSKVLRVKQKLTGGSRGERTALHLSLCFLMSYFSPRRSSATKMGDQLVPEPQVQKKPH